MLDTATDGHRGQGEARSALGGCLPSAEQPSVLWLPPLKTLPLGFILPNVSHHRVRDLEFPSSWSLSLRVASNEEETGALDSLLLLEAPPSFHSHGEEEKEELLFTFLKLLRGRVVVKSAQWWVVQLVTPPTESLAAADNHKSPLAPLLNPEAEGVPRNAIWVSHS